MQPTTGLCVIRTLAFEVALELGVLDACHRQAGFQKVALQPNYPDAGLMVLAQRSGADEAASAAGGQTHQQACERAGDTGRDAQSNARHSCVRPSRRVWS
jgi:hypothetical protein